MTTHDSMIVATSGRLAARPPTEREDGPNTLVSMIHTADGNHHCRVDVVLPGRIAAETTSEILAVSLHAAGGPEILPDQLGLTHPLEANGHLLDPDRDELWATVVAIAYTDDAPTTKTTAQAFQDAVAIVSRDGWDESKTFRRLTGEDAFEHEDTGPRP